MSDNDFVEEQMEMFDTVDPPVIDEDSEQKNSPTIDVELSNIQFGITPSGDLTVRLGELAGGPEAVKEKFNEWWPSFEHTQEITDLMYKMQDYFTLMCDDMKRVAK